MPRIDPSTGPTIQLVFRGSGVDVADGSESSDCEEEGSVVGAAVDCEPPQEQASTAVPSTVAMELNVISNIQ
jgi:hypothetical protein